MSSPRESVKNFHRDVQRSQSNSKRVNTNLISVYNVESISDQQLRRLSFAFEVTDRSCELYRAIVLLLWNTDIRALPSRVDGDGDDGEEGRGGADGMGHIRDFLASEWSRGGPSVNGEALTSRISRISLSADSAVTRRKEDVNGSFAHQCTQLTSPQSVCWTNSRLLLLGLYRDFRIPSLGNSLGAADVLSLVLPFVFLVKRLL
jgi:hypothetical protein